jgi:hypothetical protein
MAGHLSTRGWVVQEQAMSPRTVYFGSTGLAWECLSRRVNEKEDLTGSSLKSQLTFLRLQNPTTQDLANPDNGVRAFYGAWARLLALYSRCSLTVPGDRLVALNAIMAEASRQTSFTLVAGLWKELLPAELLWYRHTPYLTPSPKETYQAPSWSWGAVLFGVKSSYAALLQNKATLDFKATVSNVYASAKPNGQVTDGSLRLFGPARQIEWLGDAEMNELHKTWSLDRNLENLEGLCVVHVVRAVGQTIKLSDDRIEESVEDKGLILQRVNFKAAAFRRVGMFQHMYFRDSPLALFGKSKWSVLIDVHVI